MNEEQIFNYLQGTATSEEKALVDNWLTDSEENNDRFNEYKRIYELSSIDTTSYQPDVDLAWSKVAKQAFASNEPVMSVSKNTGNKTNLSWVYRVAAVLVMAVGLAYFNLDNGVKEIEYALSYQTGANEKKELTLADGSVVFLNENTELKYFDTTDENLREVYLSGEAFFEVAKNPDKPFVIQSSTATTRVLGTSFNLVANESGAAVDVFTGKVAFGNLSEKSANVVLTKFQRATFQNGQATKLPGFDQNVTTWKSSKLVFDSTPLAAVVLALEKQYNKKIEFDNNIAACKITSTFDNQKLDQVLGVIKIIAQIENTEKDGIIYLSGPGC